MRREGIDWPNISVGKNKFKKRKQIRSMIIIMNTKWEMEFVHFTQLGEVD